MLDEAKGSVKAMGVSGFLQTLRREAGDRIVHLEHLEARPARYARPRRPLPDALSAALARQRISQLYVHQAQALDAARAGEAIVVTTQTASGKTLCYNLPVLETLLSDPPSCALYVFPTKALAQDQLDVLNGYGVPVRAGIYDGDTPADQRARVRDRAQILLTNPDMLHVGILPQHFRWRAFFRRLRYVVLDDLHVYRGVFGSHVANVLRRLRRVCRVYGADPQFLCASATLGNPAEFASRLVGVPVQVIDDDGAPRGARHFVLWNPPHGADGLRRSPYGEATWLFCRLVEAGVRTIVFVNARKTAELIYRRAAGALPPELAGRIRPYRAGYLAGERRRIERALFGGELLGVVATSALELGIDVGGLDASVLVGFPGTVASTWQRAGRAGRGRQEALTILIATDDALDQYLARNPGYLFGRPVEAAVIDPENPYVLASHLRCAAAEVPLREEDLTLFGSTAGAIAPVLEEIGELQSRHARWYWRGAPYPARQVGIRSAGGTYHIVDPTGRLVGTVEEGRAFEQVHPGAVYLHRGETYLVEDLDVARKVATVRRAEVDHYTEPRTVTDLAIRAVRACSPFGDAEAYLAEVEVTTHVVEYARKRLFGDEVIGVVGLDLPAEVLRTVAVGFDVPPAIARKLADFDLAGAVHAVEHAAIGLLPLFAMCDRWDIGGVSYPLHPQTGRPSIFVYDGYPGGVGVAERGFRVLEEWMRATLDAIERCPCEDGCPSCIQSPKCGNANTPLDKVGAVALLRRVLGVRSAKALVGRRTARRS
ncbi:MAG: DEAD/DEAH box helicase [Armatimonadota bacterium]|nr:DEAD/DEAH box helicase [Armatimonadota bacterium]MDR5696271.1 DEAD/DEAH box helicase [Armatimonadota bacterium]